MNKIDGDYSGLIPINAESVNKGSLYRKNFNNVLNELIYYTKINEYTSKIFEEKGMLGLLNYLNKDQKFVAATIAADWGGIIKPSSSFLGQLGHHAFIVLPGNRICEWSSDATDSKKKYSQQGDVRRVSGKVIEKIWETHLKLMPNYLTWNMASKTEGFSNYRPFKNDCFSYVDRLLVENNQQPCRLERIEKGVITSIFSMFYPEAVANAYKKPLSVSVTEENAIFDQDLEIFEL